mgnify:CR=1 FL=1
MIRGGRRGGRDLRGKCVAAAVALAPASLATAAPATYLEFCRQQRLLLPVSLSTSERENVVNQMWRARSVRR